MIQSPVLRGLVLGTLVGTAGAMLIGVTLGIVVAVMRLSEQPGALAGVAWIVHVVLPGRAAAGAAHDHGRARGALPRAKGLGLGVPFGTQLMSLFGIDNDLIFCHLDANQIFTGIIGGIIGLGLSEAAYMAEIARAGILSVDPGQREAACALGMSNGKAMRRVVLPQAMRVIVPPTGNETIAMVKDTSLLIAIPVSNELFFQLLLDRLTHLRDLPGAGGRRDLVPDHLQRADGGPVPARGLLRTWLRHLGGTGDTGMKAKMLSMVGGSK